MVATDNVRNPPGQIGDDHGGDLFRNTVGRRSVRAWLPLTAAASSAARSLSSGGWHFSLTDLLSRMRGRPGSPCQNRNQTVEKALE